uniref:Uncharacterized protein n=1 Tax=Magallana gigas TaxID=29159 RepID=K1PHK3_MAGGI
MAAVKLVLFVSMVAVVLTLPTDKSKSRSVQKRSAPSLDKRSVFDMFDKVQKFLKDPPRSESVDTADMYY